MTFWALAFWCQVDGQAVPIQLGPFPTLKRCIDVQALVEKSCPVRVRYPCWTVPVKLQPRLGNE